jgi:hypothetical protein
MYKNNLICDRDFIFKNAFVYGARRPGPAVLADPEDGREKYLLAFNRYLF